MNMPKYHFKTLKSFWKNHHFLIISLLSILLLIYMASGYGLLKNNLQITGTTKILKKNQEKLDMKETSQMTLTFQETNCQDNIFTYDIIITNNSNITYYNWQLKIEKPDYIIFPSIKENKDFFLTNSNRKSEIKPKESISVSITFEVINNIINTMTLRETANYFVNHYIYLDSYDNNIRNTIITKGKAQLMLFDYEEELTSYTLVENTNYHSNNQKEHQYLLTITNNSNKNYLGFRANLYFGKDNTILDTSFMTILNIGVGNITFEFLNSLPISPNSSQTIYLTIYEEKEIYPDIVLTAL